MATTRAKAATPSKPDPFKAAGDLPTESLTDLCKGLSEPQRAKVAKVAAKSRARADGPEMEVEFKDGAVVIRYVHEEPDLAAILLMADMATCDPHFFAGLSGQVATIGAHGRKIDQGASNFLLSVVRAVQPRDELDQKIPSRTRRWFRGLRPFGARIDRMNRSWNAHSSSDMRSRAKLVSVADTSLNHVQPVR